MVNVANAGRLTGSKMITITELKKQFKERAHELGLNVQCPMDGDINSEFALIGEGPGQNEVNEERPFVGGSGKLLWDTLRKFGILRTDCYITNVCKRQISLAANTRHPVSADEWVKWKHMIHWELEQLPNLKYILCMGNAGLSALFGLDAGITKARGSVYEYNGLQTLVTYNPAAVIREPKNEIVFVMDLKRFKTVIDGDFVPYEIKKHINPTFKEAREWIKEMRHGKAAVSWDIETIAGATACHGLANSGHEAMCINLRGRYDNRYSTEEELQLLYDLQDLFDHQTIIAQNGNFDAHWVGYKDLLNATVHFDTMLAHHTLYPSLPHSLAFLTAQYTTHPFYKDDGKEWKEGGDIDSFWRYNAVDAAITWECARLLGRELKEQKLDDFFYNHVMRLDPHLVRSTVDGVAVDTSVKSEIAAELGANVKAIEAKFLQKVRELLPDYKDYWPNIRSNTQMKALFLDKLHAKSATGSVDKEARAKMIDDVRTAQDVKDLLLIYNEYQSEAKFYSTYAEMRVDPDNRFRMVWKQQGVTRAPGRLSSAGNLWGTASNIQNQPTRAQPFFIADEGCVKFYADGSQAEARVVAYLADIDKWKRDFERARLTGDFDAHRSLASDMYKIPYDDVPKEDWVVDERTGLEVPTIRYKAKRARHGLNYRMQAPRLAEAAKLSMFDAKKTFILYHNENPEIKLWWAELEKIIKRTKELWTPLGRRFRLLGRLDEEALESIVAFVPQSTIGDMVKRTWYQCHEDDDWDNRKMRIKINVHDALIGIAVNRNYAEKACRIMRKYAEAPILIENVYKTKVEELIIPAEFKISEPDEKGVHRWSTLKKVKLD
jgi:uracil-DNA glycosylase family 4